ncbi:MAG TPA: methyltransferase domain-containing protein [Symbiobacteriaceae bacterium]|jgi:ubiquinone/menaquinone biosynthesis C-methylase UbiE|nr:methyltransferase domain-containing protein [Symbiobacteriaceae bacterium]
MERITATEILDQSVGDLAQLADSFREVFGVNRYLGGLRVLQHHLAPWVKARWNLTLVDVAGGTGDVAAALAGWARRRGTDLQATVLENHPQVLELACNRPGAAYTVTEGDARCLPFGDGTFDVAVCNLALHHFEPDEATAVLRELHRVSRLGWVVTDLDRHPLAYAGARLLAAAVWRSPITRHDGPLSVRRSYRPREVAALLRQAGVAGAAVVRHVPFRWAAVCHK